MNWDIIIDKIPSVIIVLAFSAFALKMQKDFRLFITSQQDRWMKYSEDRDAAYLGKLEKIGNNQSEGMETVSKDIQAVSKDIQAQTGVLTKLCDQMETNDELLVFIAEDVKTRQIRGD